MRKVIHKLFWIWDFDKEEKWLNAMAARGLALTSVGWCRYEFEDCVPGEFKICTEFLENKSVENAKYIEFIEETGAQHLGTFIRWAYFRKRAADGDFKLFSDNTSRIKHLTRIITFVAFLCGLNIYMGGYNLFLYALNRNAISLLGLANFLVAAVCMIGLILLLIKRKRLKTEQRVFE